MDNLAERVAYLRGLAEGMKLDENTNEGKMIFAMVDVLDEMALEISDLSDETAELNAHIDEIDEDLASVEEIVYDEEECEDFETIVDCPNCKEKVTITEENVKDDGESFTCPHCKEDVSIEWDCGCGCDCGCEEEK